LNRRHYLQLCCKQDQGISPPARKLPYLRQGSTSVGSASVLPDLFFRASSSISTFAPEGALPAKAINTVHVVAPASRCRQTEDFANNHLTDQQGLRPLKEAPDLKRSFFALNGCISEKSYFSMTADLL